MTRRLAAFCILFVAFVAKADESTGMIWVAEGERNRVYLLGSIHLLREEDHPLPAAVDAVYEDADALVMELDMDDIDPISSMQNLISLGVLEEGRTLADVMGEDMYAQAEASARDIEIPLDMFARSEPWLAAMTVQEILMMRVGYRGDLGVEMYLADRALVDGKPITGLETVEQQLRFLDGLTFETQSKWFLYSIIEAVRLEMVVDDLVDAWRNGDVAFMERELLHDMNNYPEMHEEILLQRNRSWVEPILDLLDDDDNYLVVVGAAHLVGEGGVPDLLSAEGVRIKLLHESVR